MIPGDNPRVQVKLALPEEFDEFNVHPKTLRANVPDPLAILIGKADENFIDEEEEDIIYRLGS